MKKLWAIPAVFFLSAVSLYAQDGGYAGAELRVGLGARPVAMGEAFTAVADDGSAPFFNPAGAAWVKKKVFGASYRFLEFDRRHGYLSLIVPVQGEAALGFTWINSSVGNVLERDDIGQVTGELKDHHNQFGVNFAKRFTKAVSAGVNVKYLEKMVAGVSAYSVGFDFGGQFRFRDVRRWQEHPLSGLAFGFAAENIFARMQFNSNKYYGQFGSQGANTTDTLPINFRFGASYQIREDLLLAVDAEKNLKQKTFLHAGGEYWYKKVLAARAGVSHGKASFGAGVRQAVDKKKAVRVDYVFQTSSISERGDHLFSLQFEF